MTEVIYPGLDLVKLMIDQGISERPHTQKSEITRRPDICQDSYDRMKSLGLHEHAIEGRIYAENPLRNFLPSPGLLQLVEFDGDQFEWLRIESWVCFFRTFLPRYLQ